MAAPNLLLLRLAEFLRARSQSIVADSLSLLDAETLHNKDHFPWDRELAHLVKETAERLLAGAASSEAKPGTPAEPSPPGGVQTLLLESSMVRNAFVRTLNRFQSEQSGQQDYKVHEIAETRQFCLDEFDHLYTAALSQWICGKDSRPGIRVPTALREVHGGMKAVQGLLRLAMEQVPAGSRIHISAAVQQLGRIATELQEAIGLKVDPPASPAPAAAPAKREQLRIAPLQVSRFIRTLADAFRPAAEQKGLRFESRCGPVPEVIHTDAAKLHHAATLLLDHSVSHTISGSIVLTAGLGATDRWVLGIRDTSPSLPAELLSRTLLGLAHAEEEHTALADSVLGIALARDLADLLGGTLEAESKAGDGTHFRIALPAK